MRSVFQVVASMVLANAAVAYGADAKSVLSNVKQGAAATAADAKAKAADVAKGAQTQAKDVKASAKEATQEATKKAEASQPAAAQPAPAAPVSAQTVKDAAKEAKAEGAEVAQATGVNLIIPESAVLPESVLRFRAIYGAASGTKGYDTSGNKIENGIKVTANQAVAVLEYGITDRISGQFLMPYSLGGKVSVDDKDKFTTGVVRAGFEKTYGAATTTAAATVKGLAAANALGPLSALYAGLQGGVAPTGGIDMQAVATQIAALDARAAQLPTLMAGVSIPAGANVKEFIDSKLRAAIADTRVAAAYDSSKATAEGTKFQEGLGDIEVGAKYAISTIKDPVLAGIPLYLSAGVGVRLPTGKFLDAVKDGKTPAGRGTTDLGIRLNADYEPLNGLQLQVEDQTELMLAKGKTYSNSKEVDLERTGMRHKGYTKLVLAPGAWVSAAEMVLLNARYNWDNDAKKKIDGVEDAEYTVARSAQVGVSIDGLKMKLPVQLDYDRVIAARSRNVSAALDANVFTLKLFYKF